MLSMEVRDGQMLIGVDNENEIRPAGNSVSNAPYSNTTVLNANPVLKERPFNAKAVDGSSTPITSDIYSDLAFTLTDAVCDGTLTVIDGYGAELGFIKDGSVVTSIVCAGAGTNYHHCLIVNARPEQVIFVLTGRNIGSITVNTVFGV